MFCAHLASPLFCLQKKKTDQRIVLKSILHYHRKERHWGTVTPHPNILLTSIQHNSAATRIQVKKYFFVTSSGLQNFFSQDMESFIISCSDDLTPIYFLLFDLSQSAIAFSKLTIEAL